jgi:hypothetical protein
MSISAEMLASNEAFHIDRKQQPQSLRFSRRDVLLTGTSIFAAAELQSGTPATAAQTQHYASTAPVYSSEKSDLTARYDTERISRDRCCDTIIDVQGYFLSQIDNRLRTKLITNLQNFARLLGYFRIPVLVTFERPVALKGTLPSELFNSGARSAGCRAGGENVDHGSHTFR